MTLQPDMTQSDALEVPVGSLHPDWAQDWAPSIRSPRNRKALAESPRLSARPGASLAALLGIGAPGAGTADSGDLLAYKALIQQPDRFLRLIGLASVAGHLAMMIQGESVRALLANYTAEDLALALACRSVQSKAEDDDIEPDQLAAIIDSTGPRLVQNWALGLPAELRGRVRLTLPKAMVTTPADDKDLATRTYASQLIRQVAVLRTPPDSAGRTSHGRA